MVEMARSRSSLADLFTTANSSVTACSRDGSIPPGIGGAEGSHGNNGPGEVSFLTRQFHESVLESLPLVRFLPSHCHLRRGYGYVGAAGTPESSTALVLSLWGHYGYAQTTHEPRISPHLPVAMNVALIPSGEVMCRYSAERSLSQQSNR